MSTYRIQVSFRDSKFWIGLWQCVATGTVAELDKAVTLDVIIQVDGRIVCAVCSGRQRRRWRPRCSAARRVTATRWRRRPSSPAGWRAPPPSTTASQARSGRARPRAADPRPPTSNLYPARAQAAARCWSSTTRQPDRASSEGNAATYTKQVLSRSPKLIDGWLAAAGSGATACLTCRGARPTSTSWWRPGATAACSCGTFITAPPSGWPRSTRERSAARPGGSLWPEGAPPDCSQVDTAANPFRPQRPNRIGIGACAWACARVQVYAVDWSQTRGHDAIVSGSWDRSAKVVRARLPSSRFARVWRLSCLTRDLSLPPSGTPPSANH